MVADQASNPYSLDPETTFLVALYAASSSWLQVSSARGLRMWVSYKG